MAENDGEEKALFDPPLYRQRIAMVSELLHEFDVTQVLDFGCGEGKLIYFLREDPQYSRLAGVDIDLPSLQRAIVSLQPLMAHHLQPKLNPLTIELYHGSVGYIDMSFAGIDAVVSVEVIEHLDPPVLDQYRSTLFQFLRPSFAIITTPNSDFNVFFPELEIEGRFRHPDHRFEWSRAQFESWCLAIAAEFAYEVYFRGIGFHPQNHDVGGCSQMAVFSRKKDHILTPRNFKQPLSTFSNPAQVPLGSFGSYEKIYEIQYPYVKNLGQAARALVWSALQNDEPSFDSSGNGTASDNQLIQSIEVLLESTPKLKLLCKDDIVKLKTWLSEADEKMPLKIIENGQSFLVEALLNQDDDVWSSANLSKQYQAQMNYESLLSDNTVADSDLW